MDFIVCFRRCPDAACSQGKEEDLPKEASRKEAELPGSRDGAGWRSRVLERLDVGFFWGVDHIWTFFGVLFGIQGLKARAAPGLWGALLPVTWDPH